MNEVCTALSWLHQCASGKHPKTRHILFHTNEQTNKQSRTYGTYLHKHRHQTLDTDIPLSHCLLFTPLTRTHTHITGGTLSGQDYPNVLFPDKWINATFSFDFFAEAETLYRGAT